MNNFEIEAICKSDKCLRNMVRRVVARDELSTITIRNFPSAYVCNTDKKSQPGVHWVAFVFFHDHCEYFDPVGMPPQYSEFWKFITRNSKKHRIFDRSLQTPFTSVCGQYCIWYLYLRCNKKSVSFIKKLFGSNTADNDRKVLNLVKRKFGYDSKLVDWDFLTDRMSKRFEETVRSNPPKRRRTGYTYKP